MIKSDKWIRRMAAEARMIEPFESGQVREAGGHKIVSYGTSSYGYDIRCSNEFKLFTNPAMTDYVASSDGQRFLLNLPAGSDVAAVPSITVVLNWQSAFKQ